MFKTTINWAAQAAYLTSDRFLDNSQVYAWKQAIFDYQPYIDTNCRDNDVAFALQHLSNKDGKLCLNDLLNKQAIYFLEWKGNRFEVKPERLQEWLSFVSLVDPCWIISTAYVHL